MGTSTATVPSLAGEQAAFDIYGRGVRSAADDDPIHCRSLYCLRFHRYLSALYATRPSPSGLQPTVNPLYRSFDEVIEAAQAGDPEAEFELGHVLSSQGLGVKPDIARARWWFARASRHGSHPAMLALVELKRPAARP